MSFLESVSYVDLIGYFGGGITLWGIYQKTMIPLRVGAVIGNLGFIGFGLLAGSYPTLVLHAVLLPLNGYRLYQMMRLVRDIRDSAGQDNSLEPLLPFMQRVREEAGTVLFRKDDAPDRMIVIHSGSIVLEEIAAFTPDNRRTCTAVCETECELFTLSNDAMVQLFYQNPRFGMFLVRVVVQRLLKNWRDADARAQALLT
jgi:hypothetical protein